MKISHFGIEPLEARIAPASFLVTTIADSGPGSLRQAILDANTQAGPDQITFNIGAGSVIKLASHLPAITDRVSIIGKSGTTKIGIDGTSAIGGDGINNGSGLLLFGPASDHSIITGLAIYGFDIAGIETLNSSSNDIISNYLGLTTTALSVSKQTVHGILVSGGTSNNIGGQGANAIGGNDIGIRITGGAVSTLLANNTIGYSPLGGYATTRPNDTGILVENASATRIDFNKISHNLTFGIKLTASAYGTNITRNTIGASGSGLDTFNAQDWGIFIDRAQNTTIGGGTYQTQGRTGNGNLITGNTSGGIWIQVGRLDSYNQIIGNIVGGSNTSESKTGNGGPGILVTRPQTAEVSPASLQISWNLISANSGAGIELRGVGSKHSCTIYNNRIGADFSGVKPLGNGYGIIVDGTDNVALGISDRAGKNTIVASALEGILIKNSNNVTLVANNIGLAVNASNLASMGNGSHGIHVVDSGSVDITGGNFVAYNGGNGIFLDGGDVALRKLLPDVSIRGNFIGTNGKTALANTDAGIRISNLPAGSHARIADGNIIDGGLATGIEIERSDDVEIIGNIVSSRYTALEIAASDGTIVLDNQFQSEDAETVRIERDSSSITFGYESRGNIVTNSSGIALLIRDGHDNAIVGNQFESATSAVSILAGENNFLSGNRFTVPDDGLFIDLNGDGRTPNDPIDADSGPNTLLNSPLLASAALRGGQTLLRGEYRGLANVDVRIEWYVGGELLAEQIVHTDENGVAKLTLNLDQEVVSGSRIHASATVESNTSEFSQGITATTPPEVIAKGAGSGHRPRVQLRDVLTGETILDQLAYANNFRGGVSVATADVDVDGFTDLIATTRTSTSMVKVFSGLDGHLISQFKAGPAGSAIRSIAAGDLDGDGSIEVIIGRARTMGGIVSVHDTLTGAAEARFTPFGFNTPDRLKVSLSDVDGDELPEIIVRAEIFGGVKEATIDPIASIAARLARILIR